MADMFDRLLAEPVRGSFAPDVQDQWDTDPAITRWRQGFRDKYGEEPSTDPTVAKYDYSAAIRAGARPDSSGHWSSEYKADDHPRRFLDINGVRTDTKTGQPAAPQVEGAGDMFDRLLAEPTQAPAAPPSATFGGTALKPGVFDKAQRQLGLDIRKTRAEAAIAAHADEDITPESLAETKKGLVPELQYDKPYIGPYGASAVELPDEQQSPEYRRWKEQERILEATQATTPEGAIEDMAADLGMTPEEYRKANPDADLHAELKLKGPVETGEMLSDFTPWWERIPGYGSAVELHGVVALRQAADRLANYDKAVADLDERVTKATKGFMASDAMKAGVLDQDEYDRLQRERQSLDQERDQDAELLSTTHNKLVELGIRGTTAGADVASGLVHSATFMAEFAATAGAAAVARNVIKKAGFKMLGKVSAKGLAGRVVRGVGRKVLTGAGGVAAAAGRTVTPIGLLRTAAAAERQRVPDFEFTDTGAIKDTGEGMGAWEAYSREFAGTMITNMAETSGRAMTAPLRKVGGLLARTGAFGGLARTTAAIARRTPRMMGIMKRLGWDGMFEEHLEEFAEKAGRIAAGLEGEERDWAKIIPTEREAWVQAWVIGIPAGVFGGIHAAGLIAKGKKGEFKRDPKDVEFYKGEGLSDAEIAELPNKGLNEILQGMADDAVAATAKPPVSEVAKAEPEVEKAAKAEPAAKPTPAEGEVPTPVEPPAPQAAGPEVKQAEGLVSPSEKTEGPAAPAEGEAAPDVQEKSPQALKDKWRAKGVTLELHAAEGADTMSIGMLEVPKDQRKQGIGTEVMQDVVALADAMGRRVELTVGLKDKLHGTTSRARLIKFYKRFGFVENKGRNKDFRTSASMYREPTKPAPNATSAAIQKAKDAKLDLADIKGTGAGGQVTSADVSRAVKAKKAPAAPQAREAAPERVPAEKTPPKATEPTGGAEVAQEAAQRGGRITMSHQDELTLNIGAVILDAKGREFQVKRMHKDRLSDKWTIEANPRNKRGEWAKRIVVFHPATQEIYRQPTREQKEAVRSAKAAEEMAKLTPAQPAEGKQPWEMSADTMRSRLGEKFTKWAKDEDVDPADNENVRQYLDETHSLTLRDDGLIEVDWRLDDETAEVIGDMPIVVHHATGESVLPQIAEGGLSPQTVDVNRLGRGEAAGVYVSTRSGGIEIDSYRRGAEQAYGGEAVLLEIKTTIDRLRADPDDADIESGATQFILPRVAAKDIINLNDAIAKLGKPTVAKPAPVEKKAPAIRPKELVVTHDSVRNGVRFKELSYKGEAVGTIEWVRLGGVKWATYAEGFYSPAKTEAAAKREMARSLSETGTRAKSAAVPQEGAEKGGQTYEFGTTQQAQAWAKKNADAFVPGSVSLRKGSGKVLGAPAAVQFALKPGATVETPGGWYLDVDGKAVWLTQDQDSSGLRGPYSRSVAAELAGVPSPTLRKPPAPAKPARKPTVAKGEKFELEPPAPLTPFTFHETPEKMVRAREIWESLAAARKVFTDRPQYYYINESQEDKTARKAKEEAATAAQRTNAFSAEDQALILDMERAGLLSTFADGTVKIEVDAYSLVPRATTTEAKPQAEVIAELEKRAEKPTDLSVNLKKMDKKQKNALAAFIKLVPEVAIDPAFEVVEKKLGKKTVKVLRFRDGYRFDFKADQMGLDEAQLTVGQRVAIPLKQLLIRQETLAKKARAGIQDRKPKAPAKKGVRKPPSPPDAIKAKTAKDLLKPVLGPFVASEHSHYAISGISVKTNELIATDGHKLIIVKHKGAAKELGVRPTKGKDVILALDGKTKIEGNFPRHEDVVPKISEPVTSFDLKKAWAAVRQAELVTTEESRGVAMHLNPDGSLGFSARGPEVGEAEADVQKDSLVLAAFNPKFLRESFESLVRLGHDTAEVFWQAGNKPTLFRTANADIVLMPVNLGEVGATPEQVAKFEITRPKVRPVVKPTKKKAPAAEKPKGKGAAGQAMAAAGEGSGYGAVEPSGKGKAGKPTRTGEPRREQLERRSILHVLDNLLAYGDEALKIAAPGARKGEAREGANVIRADLGQLAHESEVSAEHLRTARRSFMLMGEERALEFFDRIESGQQQEDPKHQAIAKKFRKALDEGRELVRSLGKGHLEKFIEHYFPHMWKNPRKASVILGQILGKRPLQGSKSFLKQRTIVTIRQGVEAGLQPVSWNPVDLVLLKLHEMRRFVMAHQILSDLKTRGLAKFVPSGLDIKVNPPAGWTQIKDNTFNVILPPEVHVAEAFDDLMVSNLMGFARDLGIDAQRVMKMRGTKWGYAQGTSTVRTKFAGPVSVLAHEIGHILGTRYGLHDWMRQAGTGEYQMITRGPNAGQSRFVPARSAIDHRKVIDAEWRALADARFERGDPKAGFKKYVRKRAEKEAVLLEAFLHAPEKMAKVAPTVTKLFKKFLGDHAELKPLLEIGPSLVLGTGSGTMKLPGITELGKYYAPEPVATLLNNYLSPGLINHPNKLISGLYDATRRAGNLLNQANLAFSFFHLLNTGFDSIATQFGTGLRQIAATKGQQLRGLANIATAPLAAAGNLWQGRKLAKAYRKDFDSIKDPKLRALVEALVLSGGRTRMDPFYYNRAIRGMGATLHNIFLSSGRGHVGRKVKGVMKLPFNIVGSALEIVAKPVMEWWVPRMKLGAFYKMATMEMARARDGNLTDKELHENLSRVWDSIDNRMGQLVYDNLFWNKTLRDGLMLGVRSVGWNLGSWREYGGMPLDVLTTRGRMARGDTWLSHKMGYVMSIALTYAITSAIIQYLLTGEPPDETKDYFYPKTGRTNPDGSEERLSLPTYAKDFYGYKDQPGRTIVNKLHPLTRLVHDLATNADFTNTQIVAPDDPLVQQLQDAAKHIANAFIPFSVRSHERLKKGGMAADDAFLVAATGIGPAPAYIARTDAQKLMMKYIIAKLPQGTRTQAKFARSVARKELIRLARGGKDVRDEAAAAGFRAKDITRILKEAQMLPFEASFKRLSFEEALNVYVIATRQERTQALGILKGKYGRAEKGGADWGDKERLFREMVPDYTPTATFSSSGRGGSRSGGSRTGTGRQ